MVNNKLKALYSDNSSKLILYKKHDYKKVAEKDYVIKFIQCYHSLKNTHQYNRSQFAGVLTF